MARIGELGGRGWLAARSVLTSAWGHTKAMLAPVTRRLRRGFFAMRNRFSAVGFRFTRRRSWLSYEINQALKNVNFGRERPSRLVRLALPTWWAIGSLVALYFVLVPVSWVLARWHPPISGVLHGVAIVPVYLGMWSVAAAVAVLALPLLLFVIQVPREAQQAARSSEVLIRESWVFPIIAFSLFGVARMGVDVVWFPRRIVFLFDFFFVFLATILLASFAYYAVVRLLFSPALMKAKALRLVEEKLLVSIEESIRLRLGTNRLTAWFPAHGIAYWPFSPTANENATHLYLRATTAGRLSDVNLERLDAFIRRLPYRSQAPAAPALLAPQPGPGAPAPTQQPVVWMTRLYGQGLELDDPLLRLDRAAFLDIDRVALERELSLCFRIRSDQ